MVHNTKLDPSGLLVNASFKSKYHELEQVDKVAKTFLLGLRNKL